MRKESGWFRIGVGLFFLSSILVLEGCQGVKKNTHGLMKWQCPNDNTKNPPCVEYDWCDCPKR